MNKKLPLVTVCIGFFNEEKYLAKTIENIINQDYQNLEILMSDNCSTDSSYKIAQSYQKKDSRIHLRRNKHNIGSSNNFNQLMESGKGKYCMLVGAHDLRQHNMISKLVDAMEKDESMVIAHPKAVWIDEKDKTIGKINSALTTTQIKSPRLRVCTVLFSHGYGSVVYGLMRYSALRKVAMHSKIIACDVLWMSEMSFYGTIFYDSSVTLYCRQIPSAGGWEKYVERIYGKNYYDLSPKTMIFEMCNAFKQGLSKHFKNESDKKLVSTVAMLALQSKYQFFDNLQLFRDGDTLIKDAWEESFKGMSSQVDAFLEKMEE